MTTPAQISIRIVRRGDPEPPWADLGDYYESDGPIGLAAIEGGTSSGKPALVLRIPGPAGRPVITSTTLDTLISAVAGLRGGFPASFEGTDLAGPPPPEALAEVLGAAFRDAFAADPLGDEPVTVEIAGHAYQIRRIRLGGRGGLPIVNRVTVLLTPAGMLRVEDTWQPLVMEDAGPVVAWLLTQRAAYLGGRLVPWSPATRDLLASAADAIAGGPPGRGPVLVDTEPGTLTP